MRLKEISHSTLLMKISETFCCGWSEDDKFFVITSTGLDVFHFKPDPKSKLDELSFIRSFIYPVHYYPTEHAGFDEFEIENLSKDDLATILYDPLIVPRLRFFTCDAPLYFTQVLWSPVRVMPCQESVLALLTSAGGATLWIYKTNCWTVLADISNFILLRLKGQNMLTPLKIKSLNYMAKFQERCYKLATSSITWSGAYMNKRHATVFFVSVQKNGDVYVWRVAAKNLLNVELETDLEIFHESGFRNVCSSSWVHFSQTKALLVVGTMLGRVHCLHFNVSQDYKLTYEKTITIWQDEDQIKLSQIQSTWFGSKVSIVLIKASFLISILLNEDGGVINTTHSHLDNLNITSSQELEKNSFAIANLTGAVSILRLAEMHEDCILISNSQVQSDVNFGRWALHGMCVSKNQAIWVMCLNPCKTMQRELGKSCSRIVFLQQADVDPMVSVHNIESDLLTEHWDLMEVARIGALRAKHIPASWATQWSENMHDYQIKVCLWSTYMANIILIAEEKAQELRKRILLRHVERYLPALVFKSSEAPLSEFDLLTGQLMVNFLKHCNKTIKKGQLDKFIECHEMTLFPETGAQLQMQCEWCEEILEDTVCSKKHPRQWCCVTLQNVDDAGSLACTVCGCCAHASLVTEGLRCTFCDTYLKSYSLFSKQVTGNGS